MVTTLIGIFIDLSKAFDTVNHEILLCKLKSYGINSKMYNILKNYLQNRKQHITYNKRFLTEALNITCDVMHGSILGPLLFLIDVNDLVNCSSELSTVMFADDTNLFMSDKNISTLFNNMENELQKVTKWFQANKLSLNVKKTKYTLFHPSSKKISSRRTS